MISSSHRHMSRAPDIASLHNVASSHCLIVVSPASYCLIVKGSRGVGEQFVVVGFGYGRPSVFVRRGRYLTGGVRMLIPSSTVSLPPPFLHQPRYLSAPPTPQNAAASSLVFGVFLLFGRVGRLPRLVAWSFGGCVVLCVLRSGGAALLLRELRCCAVGRGRGGGGFELLGGGQHRKALACCCCSWDQERSRNDQKCRMLGRSCLR